MAVNRLVYVSIAAVAAILAAVSQRGGPESTEHVLALNWQPAFCETRPRTSECRRLNDGETPNATRRLSLHGLWPQPRERAYCGVDDGVRRRDVAGEWSRLPEPGLDAETSIALSEAMPGVASGLDRHEWIKHGTCHGTDADAYFDDALNVTAAVNGSPVGRLFADNIGRRVSASDVRAAFDAGFGDGAGARVRIECVDDDGRKLIKELRINLSGRIEPEASVAELIRAAPPAAAGCAGGVVDPAGLQ